MHSHPFKILFSSPKPPKFKIFGKGLLSISSEKEHVEYFKKIYLFINKSGYKIGEREPLRKIFNDEFAISPIPLEDFLYLKKMIDQYESLSNVENHQQINFLVGIFYQEARNIFYDKLEKKCLSLIQKIDLFDHEFIAIVASLQKIVTQCKVSLDQTEEFNLQKLNSLYQSWQPICEVLNSCCDLQKNYEQSKNKAAQDWKIKLMSSLKNDVFNILKDFVVDKNVDPNPYILFKKIWEKIIVFHRLIRQKEIIKPTLCKVIEDTILLNPNFLAHYAAVKERIKESSPQIDPPPSAASSGSPQIEEEKRPNKPSTI